MAEVTNGKLGGEKHIPATLHRFFVVSMVVEKLEQLDFSKGNHPWKILVSHFAVSFWGFLWMFGFNLTFQMRVFRKCLIRSKAMFMEGNTKKYVGRGPFIVFVHG